ncbi:histidine kinase [Hyphococcus sp.]|uniref:histidine kinase n=1 Tax=Hyphococcus sp. TaxID=2038636 RepID=UPI0020820E5A|nr:MAG: hypothetical protein DHS20C04_15810 [Marinicaulis sp.]
MAEWSSPELDDSDWADFSEFQSAPSGAFWIRYYLDLGFDTNTENPANMVLDCSGTGAFDVYFDGALLGSSGRVANVTAVETPGSLKFAVSVPQPFLTTGVHVVALRASAAKLSSPADFRLTCNLKNSDDYMGSIIFSMLLLGFSGAASAILLLYFLFALPSVRQRASSLAALCVAIATTLLATTEASYQAGFTDYTQALASDVIAQLSALAIYFALPATVLLRLNLKRKIRWLLGACLLLVLSLIPWNITSFDHDARAFLSLCVLCIAMCLTAKGSTFRQRSIFAVTFTICFIGIFVDPQNLYVFLVMLAVFLSASLVDHLRTQELQAKQAEVTAARLEADLIRRNIQPHFLMNSLTVVSEWIETSPSSALAFIEGLAKEFRLLATHSEKKLIPLQDELSLCRTHLELMGMRHGRNFELLTEGLDENEPSPPGLFHTLIENAFSHNRYTDDLVIFSLTRRADKNGIQYEFRAPLGKSTGHAHSSTGAGLRYVRSRLEESFSQRWTLNSYSEGGAWITDIRIAKQ